ncbi:MAG: YoaK family protein, partial [Collinsella sp.]|nr:YoaK family protein [Collinsella sp.]
MERAKQVSESIELVVILALVGGFMDAYSYMGRGGVFANAQTGNILLTGIHLSQGELSLAGTFFLPVLAFALGIMSSDLVHERFGSAIHWRQVMVVVEALILLVVGFMGPHLNLEANCLTSLACGMQVESFRKM